MKVTEMSLPGVLLLEPRLFEDERGFFMESYNQKKFLQLTNVAESFVQDNHSRSLKNVLRGLHYQVEKPQGKLVRVTHGEIFDVVVDLRQSSPTFGHWVSAILSSENRRILWVPKGFAHGFLAVSDTVDVMYKTTDFYDPAVARCIIWNDPTLNINWPLACPPLLSANDAQGLFLQHAELFT